MIKLIVGLGNPGRQYEKTRHNAGFLFLDRLVSDSNCDWVRESRFDGLLAEIGGAGGKVLLLKPSTFMNRSGQAVGKVARYYKLVPDEILVVHDELDFDVGVVRLKKDGGHAGHNGLRDIIAHLGAKEFYRLRIGIGRPPAGNVVADFVLSSPSKSEWVLMSSAFDLAASYVDQVIAGDMAAVMNKLNSR
ncbi:MAG: aminoacyl-tRNA hydrolase [Methylobacter sp.]|uniref:aminoacyl-tRNA hydrolase n=1 Tax=Methylobacter sp. TaxID=2051955 RepID=UPI002730418E|nr:aminoacyl-tRNA hydrolase [Methylobacter sp.]MDP1665863.1 aminoacyl-tRNA hydrolase [Methylobacter sp.]MDP1969533.1 aminoacyl-tRNA hydrolase [Methylobacter sp.]